MKEIYWLTRLDGIIDFLDVFECIGLVFGIVFLCIYILWKYIIIVNGDQEDIDSHSPYYNKLKSVSWILISIGIICSLGQVIIPTTKEACAIYVAGSVIDYAQGNETLQELPDKVISLADNYVTELIQQKDSILP